MIRDTRGTPRARGTGIVPTSFGVLIASGDATDPSSTIRATLAVPRCQSVGRATVQDLEPAGMTRDR
jgi:hypothetical protein